MKNRVPAPSSQVMESFSLGARDDGTTAGAISPNSYGKGQVDDEARYYNRALEGYEIKAMTITSNKIGCLC